MKPKLLPLTSCDADAAAGSVLNFVPDLNSAWMPMITFLVYISLNWWATWYPGAEPGGGGYIAQRMLSAKDEKHSLLATLWFNVAHYAIRPWPWILVGARLLILFPDLEGPGDRLHSRDDRYLPPSLRGLMVAGFAAAYMSTIAHATQLGRQLPGERFLPPLSGSRDRAERHYVLISQLATVLLTIISAMVTFYHGLHRRRLETADRNRRRHRQRC